MMMRRGREKKKKKRRRSVSGAWGMQVPNLPERQAAHHLPSQQLSGSSEREQKPICCINDATVALPWEGTGGDLTGNSLGPWMERTKCLIDEGHNGYNWCPLYHCNLSQKTHAATLSQDCSRQVRSG